MKWLKSEEELNFGGRWVWVPMNPPPQSKFRGDALAQRMGAESGGTGGDASSQSRYKRRTSPQKLGYFSNLFLDTYYLQFCIFQHSQNKVAEIRGETFFFLGRWVWMPMNPPPPQRKFRGGAPGATPGCSVKVGA